MTSQMLGQMPGAPARAREDQEEHAAQARQDEAREAQGVLWRDCEEDVPAPDASGVYLLALYLNGTHSPYRHAWHYMGWAQNIRERLALHRSGKGARFTQVVIAQGYEIQLVRVWPGAGRDVERQYKRWHGGARLCPICSALAHMTHAQQEQQEMHA